MGLFDVLNKSVVSNGVSPQFQIEKPLQNLVDMALCDTVLTDAEYELLLSSAKDAGCNIDEFRKYIDAQITEKKVKKVASKKFVIQHTENVSATRLKTMLDMAIADGVISDEERLILLSEAKSHGFNLSDFSKMLDIIASQAVEQTETNSNSNNRRLVSKEMISSTTTVDGNIQEVWKEVYHEKRTDTRPGATPGAQITVRVTKTITITKSNVQCKDFNIDMAVDLLTTLDYNMIMTGVGVAAIFFPTVAAIISPIILVLQKASEDYNKSTAPNKRDLYVRMILQNLSITDIIKNFPIVQKYVPHSDKIVQCIDAISKGTL